MIDTLQNHRRSIRLKNYDYSQAGLYFVTICTQNYQHLFGEILDNKMVLNDPGKMIQTEWIGLSKRFSNIQLHENIVMPNHFHGIIQIHNHTDHTDHKSRTGRTGCTGEPRVRPAPALALNFKKPSKNDHILTDEHTQKGEHKVRPYGTLAGTIGRIVQAFKSITTNAYILGVNQKGWQRFDKKLWQRNYWDRIIRNENEYNKVSQYIIDNPATWQNDKLNGGIGNQVMESQAQYGEET